MGNMSTHDLLELEEEFVTSVERLVAEYMAHTVGKPIRDELWTKLQELKYYCTEWRVANERPKR